MKITIAFPTQIDDPPQYTIAEIRDALVNTEWDKNSENPHYHSACAKRRDIRLMLASGTNYVKIEYDLSLTECLDIVDVKSLIQLVDSFNLFHGAAKNDLSWTKNGLIDFVRRKLQVSGNLGMFWQKLREKALELTKRKQWETRLTGSQSKASTP